MRQGVRTVAETADLITAGRRVLLAGDESALRGLPRGNWIGGTIPYFMTSEGGLCVRDKIFVTELPDDIIEAEPRVYDARELRDVYRDAKPSGFSLIILPGGSAVHEAFAVQAPTYPGFGTRSLVGWVAGVHLDDQTSVRPKVFSGVDGVPLSDRAVVMHMSVPAEKAVHVGILNIFQSVDRDKGEVTFDTPVFAGIDYKHAGPVGDYVAEFTARIPRTIEGVLVFSCNCILNFVYSKLEGRTTGAMVGPVTFGELPYQLMNQTLAHVTLSARGGIDDQGARAGPQRAM